MLTREYKVSIMRSSLIAHRSSLIAHRHFCATEKVSHCNRSGKFNYTTKNSPVIYSLINHSDINKLSRLSEGNSALFGDDKIFLYKCKAYRVFRDIKFLAFLVTLASVVVMGASLPLLSLLCRWKGECNDARFFHRHEDAVCFQKIKFIL